ncbi:hypothetical protein VTK73DRAFT_9026 [Phialemonium thermophilum]|uniref:Uncharacterized protein n=1 Tax=Phialemonium thermophilum TaxID=223376 RepID=A0ABR3W5C4_9PEZI
MLLFRKKVASARQHSSATPATRFCSCLLLSLLDLGTLDWAVQGLQSSYGGGNGPITEAPFSSPGHSTVYVLAILSPARRHDWTDHGPRKPRRPARGGAPCFSPSDQVCLLALFSPYRPENMLFSAGREDKKDGCHMDWDVNGDWHGCGRWCAEKRVRPPCNQIGVPINRFINPSVLALRSCLWEARVLRGNISWAV